MRFMSIVKANKASEAGEMPSPKMMEAIGKLAEEGIKSGVILDTGGLLPSSLGARVSVAGGKITVKDGPFTEAKELVGGYAIMQVRSKEEAVELGKKFMPVHLAGLGSSYEGELEVRQMFDPGDCAAPHS